MRRPPATSFPRSRVRFLVGLVLLTVLAAGSVRLAITAPASTAVASAVSLVDDAGGAALFAAADLSPGQVQAACVGLTAGGSVDPATEVSLSADASGGLTPYLQVWVERGSVPAGGSCGAFSGAVVWSGTLDQFPATGTPGIPTGWHPALTQRSVYRFTVTVLDDPRAQDQRSSATFRWSVTEATALPGPTTSPAPAPPAAPSTAAPTTAAPTTAAPTTGAPTTAAPATSSAPPGTPEATADPTTSAAAAAATTDPPSSRPASTQVPAATGPARAVVEAPPVASGPVAAVQAALAAVGQAVQQVGRTAVAVAHNGQFPLALVGIVAAFLFLQGRLDRRDPKLALARVREELSEFREFPEPPPPTETT